MNPFLLPAVILLAALSSCAKESAAVPPGYHRHADGSLHADADHAAEHTHADRQPCGEVQLAGLRIAVFQVVAIAPGKEADFDLDFAAGSSLPEAVRGWIGEASAKGALKVRFAKETPTRMHGHPEVPDPLPEGSQLWLEIDTAAGVEKGSVALR